MGSVLKILLQIWFFCNMCQCLAKLSFRFGNSRLYVTENSIHCLCYWKWYILGYITLLLVKQLFSIEFVNFLNLLYGNIFSVFFINKLANKFARVTVLVLESRTYSLDSRCLAVGDTHSLMSADVPISQTWATFWKIRITKTE